MSKKIFAANWKMHKTPQQAAEFAKNFLTKVKDDFFNHNEVMIFPQNFSLAAIATEFKNSKVQYGPQQIHTELKGAFTGENSLELAQAIGAQICLIGHSERRQFFHEDHTAINKKVKLCLEKNITPILCFGETLEDRQSNQTFDVCFKQLDEALTNIDTSKRLVLAYEPVWAIGTGQVATSDQVKEVHEKVFQKMQSSSFKNFQILYGGSVKADNAKELIGIPHVDGFLIGGASLEVDSFLRICYL